MRCIGGILHRILLKLVILMVLFVIIFYQFDHTHWTGIEYTDDLVKTNRLMNRIYFTSSTMSTVGYGDIVPRSHTCRNIVVILQIGIIICCLG